MSKEYTHIKANGIRNELKDIRKAVNKLTEALIEIHLAQTSRHEQNTHVKAEQSTELKFR